MIDFKNAEFIKLTKLDTIDHEAVIAPILVDDEVVISEYQAIRDFVIFTNKRIIAVNVQGFTGKKKDFTSLPYSRIQAFSVETAGVFDWDAELEIYFSGLGKVKFEFAGTSDIAEIGKMISKMVLQ